MKQIDTLVSDIYDMFDNGHECSQELLDDFADSMAAMLKQRLHDSARQHGGGLRASNYGRPCTRALWYADKGEASETLRAHTKIKFLFGDIIEELVLYLTREAGHTVTRQQEEVTYAGLVGHIDAVVDGVLVDVKSASPFSYKKFKDGELTSENDPFGYIPQLSFYQEGMNIDRCGFLVMDKVNGHLCFHEPEDLIDAADLVGERKAALEGELPPRSFKDKIDGKSGNMKLGMECSYCAYKGTCWPNARTFIYSNGPRF